METTPVHKLIIKTVAATLYEVADWTPFMTMSPGSGILTAQEVRSIGSRIETENPSAWTCCPLCQHCTCDPGCALYPVRRDFGVM